MVEAGSASSRRSILLSFLAVLVLMIGSAGALIAFAWMAIDQQEAVRERVLAARTLARTLDQTVKDTVTAASWDEAYRSVGDRIDPAWADRSLTTYFHTSFDHDVTLIFTPEGRLGYAGRGGERANPADYAELARNVSPFVDEAQIREFMRRTGAAPPGPRATGNAVFFGRSVRAGGDVYRLGIATVAPTNGTARGRRTATVIVTGRRLDGRLMQSLDQDLGIRGARLAYAQPPAGAAYAVVPDVRGRPLAYVVWDPLKPGMEVLARVSGWVAFGLLLLMAAVFALGVHIKRLFDQGEEKDQALRGALKELIAASTAAEAANAAKSQFLANMSHEIRTPLNGVLGMAQVMERGELNDEQRERVRVITRSGKALLEILNDILDLSKIEAGKLDIHPAAFRLEEVVDGVREAYDGVALSKGIVLAVGLDEGLAGGWRGDAARLRQILLNLVSNAVKFTDWGEVRLSVEAGPGVVRFRVADQGIGIPPDKIGLLFSKFTQVDASATRRVGGTGLGLAICRELAELMGGSITVTSEVGAGSVFTLTLPLERLPDAPAEEIVRAAEDEAERPRVSILAAEDNATNRLVLQALLQPTGAALTFATNGEEAVDAWCARAFDLVLMDVQMPVLDGVAATRRIRALEIETGRPRTPIVALTANAMTHQIEDYRSAGMDSHVAKPIDMDQLYAAITATLQQAA